MSPKLLFYLILIIGLYIIVNLARSNWEIYKKGDRIKQTQEQTTKLKKEIQELELKKQEVFNPDFIEKEIKEKLGLEKGLDTPTPQASVAGEKKE